MLLEAGFLFVVVSTLSGLTGSARAASQESGGNPWWLWIVVLVLLGAFVGSMLLWWMRSTAEEEAPPTRAQPGPPLPAEPAGIHDEAATAESLRVDDLEMIEGIGPKIAGTLRDAGVYTFAQLAGLDPEPLKQILRDRNPNLLRLADPTTWPEQARLAAAGDWEALARLQDGLKGGRRV